MEMSMPARTSFLARLIGLFLIAMGLPMTLNKADMVGAIAQVVHDPALLLTFGMITLALGLALVMGHTVWSGGAAPVIVTLFGWALLAKSVVLLFLSPAAVAGLYAMVRFSDFYYVDVAAVVAIGLYLTYAGFRPAAANP
jgi:hypothetical protein